MSDPTEELANKNFMARLSNVYLSILALFCFKLFIKISLNLLTYFYIVRGNRKEAARISAEFYECQQRSEYSEEEHQKSLKGVVVVLRCFLCSTNYIILIYLLTKGTFGVTTILFTQYTKATCLTSGV